MRRGKSLRPATAKVVITISARAMANRQWIRPARICRRKATAMAAVRTKLKAEPMVPKSPPRSDSLCWAMNQASGILSPSQ